MKDSAINWVKQNKNQELVFQDLLSRATPVTSSDNPVALFMAGSPGAGKTEVVDSLTPIFTTDKPIVLNPDSFRNYFTDYDGRNAETFQEPAIPAGWCRRKPSSGLRLDQ